MEHEAFFAPLEIKFADDAASPGKFEGYGAVFGNIDSYGDVIQKGAFKETLRDWGKSKKLPPMLSQHGGWMMSDMDAIPVGVWEAMSEDDTGLHVKGRLINLDTDDGKRIYGAMKEGALDGMSIGYRAKEFALGTKPEEPRRTLKKIDLFEVSVVTFPANGKARVSSIKAATGLADRLSDEEGLELARHLAKKHGFGLFAQERIDAIERAATAQRLAEKKRLTSSILSVSAPR